MRLQKRHAVIAILLLGSWPLARVVVEGVFYSRCTALRLVYGEFGLRTGRMPESKQELLQRVRSDTLVYIEKALDSPIRVHGEVRPKAIVVTTIVAFPFSPIRVREEFPRKATIPRYFDWLVSQPEDLIR